MNAIGDIGKGRIYIAPKSSVFHTTIDFQSASLFIVHNFSFSLLNPSTMAYSKLVALLSVAAVVQGDAASYRANAVCNK